jgi:hypothetical protein
MYSLAEQQAKMQGELAKARRFNRALATLTDLVKFTFEAFGFFKASPLNVKL